MDFATAAQAGYWERYQATLAAIVDSLIDLTDALQSGAMPAVEYSDKALCLANLRAQADALWESLKPVVVWS